MASTHREPSLAQLIRRSPALDSAARRQWLAVLPHLAPDDRERLREILLESTPHPPAITPTMGPPTPTASPLRGRGGEGTD